MTRFDPDPDRPYATCNDCSETFSTREEMSAHFGATFTGVGSSHSARIMNPTREERIFRDLDDEVDSLVDDLLERAWRLVDQGATEDEVLKALRRIDIDLGQAWEDSE